MWVEFCYLPKNVIVSKVSSLCLSCMKGERLCTAHVALSALKAVFGDDTDNGVPKVLKMSLIPVCRASQSPER